jgi:hypothetical protein
MLMLDISALPQVGQPFGSKIFSRTSAGYIFALSPTPELWSQVRACHQKATRHTAATADLVHLRCITVRS